MYIMKRENIITCYRPVKINTAQTTLLLLPGFFYIFFSSQQLLEFFLWFFFYHRRLPHCFLSTEIIGDFIRLERATRERNRRRNFGVHRLGIKQTNMGKESGGGRKRKKKKKREKERTRAWGTCRTIEDGWAHLGPSRLANRCMVLKKRRRRRRAKNKETETNRQRTVFDVLLLMASRLQTNVPTDWETRKEEEEGAAGWGTLLRIDSFPMRRKNPKIFKGQRDKKKNKTLSFHFGILFYIYSSGWLMSDSSIIPAEISLNNIRGKIKRETKDDCCGFAAIICKEHGERERPAFSKALGNFNMRE